MEEKHALIGILLVFALSVGSVLILNSGASGAAVERSYIACCCNILTDANDAGQFLVRSQVQTFAPDCNSACERYDVHGNVFASKGLCRENQ